MRLGSWVLAAILTAPLCAFAEVRFASPLIQVSEGVGTLEIPVVLTDQDSAAGTVTVNYSTVNGDAQAPLDYQTTGGTLVWAMDDFAEKRISVPIIQDTRNEAIERFQVVLTSPTGSVLGSPATTQVEIVDDDVPGAGEFQFGVTDLLVFETSETATLRVRRINGGTGAVSVEVSRVGGGTAQPGVDFSDAAQLLSWADGELGEKTFTIQIRQDTLVEEVETIRYQLFNPSGGATITRGEATIAIGDDDVEDAGSITLVSDQIEVIEDQGLAVLNFARVGGTNGRLSLRYATQAQTATAADFTPSVGTLTWDNGNSAPQSVSITLNRDRIQEETETFVVQITPAADTTFDGSLRPVVSIIDDDRFEPANILKLSASTYRVEADSPALTVTLERDFPQDVSTVELRATPISATPDDFSFTSRLVQFNAGETKRMVTIPIRANGGVEEPEEIFLLTLESPTNGQIASPDSALVTIGATEVEEPGISRVMVQASAVSSAPNCGIQEVIPTIRVPAASAAATLTLRREGPTGAAASVAFRTIPCSANTQDFETGTGSVLNWPAGDSGTRTVGISITREARDPDPEEDFLVVLEPGVGTEVPAERIRIVIEPQVLEPEAEPDQLVLGQDSVSVGGGSATAEIEVRRVGSGAGAVTLDFVTESGSATEIEDFLPQQGQLRWADGDTSERRIVVRIVNGNLRTMSESFVVRISNPMGARLSGPAAVSVALLAPASASIRVVDTRLKISDAEGGARIRVLPSGGETALRLRYETTNATALAGVDYTATQGVLEWNVNDRGPKEIFVPVTRAAQPVPSREFTVRFSVESGNAVISGAPVATVELESDAAELSEGVGGCTLGKTDGALFYAMLLVSLLWVGLRRRAHAR